MSRSNIEKILKRYKTVAVVGISRNLEKDSHLVGEYLKAHNFRIIPVNPSADEVLGIKSYDSLLDIPPEIQKTIEVVNIFRPSEEVPYIIEQAIRIRDLYGVLQAIWLQLGIFNEVAVKAAKKAGLMVIANKCMMVEHNRIFSD